MQNQNIGTHAYRVWLKGQDYEVRALDANEAKHTIAKRLLSQTGEAFSPTHVNQLARMATAKKINALRGFS